MNRIILQKMGIGPVSYTHLVVYKRQEQNNIMINFSNSNYVELEGKDEYQYKLEGFDEDWVLTNQLRVNYTNLAPGNYILKVRDFGNKVENGEPKEIMLDITIHSPWFATVWALSLIHI